MNTTFHTHIWSAIWNNVFCCRQMRFTRLSKMLCHLPHIRHKVSSIEAFCPLLHHWRGTLWRSYSRNCISCRYSYTVDGATYLPVLHFLTFGIDVTLSTTPASDAFPPIAPFSLLHTGCLKAAISWSHWHPGALHQAMLFSSPHFCNPQFLLWDITRKWFLRVFSVKNDVFVLCWLIYSF